MAVNRLIKEDVILAAIDFQEKLLPAMSDPEGIIKNALILTKGLRVLNIPFAVTQQYTKGIGETVEPMKEALGDFRHIEKTSFSAWKTEEFREMLKASGKKTVVLMGVETHICVEQTALDLLENDYKVFLAADCVGSRSPLNRDISVRRMEQAGAVITCAESILYELMGDSKAPEFKAISKIVK